MANKRRCLISSYSFPQSFVADQFYRPLLTIHNPRFTMPFQSTVGDYQTVATLETFGFLPPMSQDEIYDQIAYIIAQGWSPVIEHVHPSGSMQTYWSYWKLPFFGEKDLNMVVSELDACHRAYPDHHVRMVGYDAYTQSQGTCFVVFEGR